MNGEDTQRLPREWLPEPSPRDTDPVWDVRTARILAAAGQERVAPAAGTGARAAHAKARRRLAAEWLPALARLWRPAAALAAGAIIALVSGGLPRAERTQPAPDSLPLLLVAGQGDPTVVAGALAPASDPVLALIAIGQPEPDASATTRHDGGTDER